MVVFQAIVVEEQCTGLSDYLAHPHPLTQCIYGSSTQSAFELSGPLPSSAY